MAEPITAINGKVTINKAGAGLAEQLHVRKWSMSKTADNQEYASSSTDGHKKSALGQKSKNVTMDCFCDGATFPTLTEGMILTSIYLYTDDTENEGYQGIVNTIDNIEADIEGSGMVSFTMTAAIWPL